MSTENDLRGLRAEHIGSLVHPEPLREVFLRHDRYVAGEEELVQAQDEAVRDVIRKQETLGLRVVGDGELRRRNFQESFSACVSGFDVTPEAARSYAHENVNKTPLERAEQDFDAVGPAITTRRKTVAKLRLTRNLPLEEYRFASGAAGRLVKPTLIGPDRIAQRFKWEESRSVYPGGLDEFTDDVVRIERSMIADMVAAGCRYIQIDAPGYTAYVDRVSLDRMRSRGEDPDEPGALHPRGQRPDRRLPGGDLRHPPVPGERPYPRPPDRRAGAPVASGGPLRRHRRAPLQRPETPPVPAGVRQRARGLLRAAPVRAPGQDGRARLVTTKSARLESVDELRKRVDEASRHCPLDQLALSPQCGFASGLYHESLSEDDQWRKLDRIVETASAIWGGT